MNELEKKENYMAEILHFDGRIEAIQPRNGTDFQLDELKPIIMEGVESPGYQSMIEVVRCSDGVHILVCNEESKLLDLPRNEEATRRAGLPTPEERAEAIAEYRKQGYFVIEGLGPDEEDYIAGSCLWCLDTEVR